MLSSSQGNFGRIPFYQNNYANVQQMQPSFISFNKSSFPMPCSIGINPAVNSQYSKEMGRFIVPPNFIPHVYNYGKQLKPYSHRSMTPKANQKKKLKNNEKPKESKTPRRKFSPEEDEKLKELVEKMGSKKWELIAKEMPGRTGRQCRDRYQNYLIPGFFNGQWSKEEDDLLQRKYMEYGSQWSKMKVFFSNRSANALKNRWNYFVSRNLCSQPSEQQVEITINSNVETSETLNEMNVEEDKTDGKNDILYESIINYTSSLAFIDLEPVNDNDGFICKEEYSTYPYMSNDLIIDE